MAATHPNAIGQTLNLGTGREISIGDLALLIAKLLGKDVNIEAESVRLRPKGSEVERLVAENKLAKDILEWEPTVTLETGLSQTIEWFEQHLDRNHLEYTI